MASYFFFEQREEKKPVAGLTKQRNAGEDPGQAGVDQADEDPGVRQELRQDPKPLDQPIKYIGRQIIDRLKKKR